MRTRLFLLLLVLGCGAPVFHAQPGAVRHTALVPPPATDTEIVALAVHHGACLGSCPIYYYSFAREGHGIREGVGFVPFPRCAVGQLPAGAFDDLARRLLASGFFGRDSMVGPVIRDVPYLTVIARLRDGRGHAVSGAMTPSELRDISIAIDSVGALVAWDSVPPIGRRRPECPWPAGDATHR